MWRLTREGDVIVAKTDPPLISLMGAVVARLRGARLVNWLQDLFPEVAEALGVRMGKNARTAFENEFDQAHALAKWRALLDSHRG